MSLCEQLKGIIARHLEKHSNVSINGLAKKTGVGATTIRRILNLTIKNEPAPHTVLSLVSTIYKEKRVPVLLDQLEGPVGELLSKYFSHYTYNEVEYTFSPDLNQVLKDKINYIIYKLAANRSGVCIDEVERLYGGIGLGRVKELKDVGLLIEDERGTLHAAEKNFSLDLQLAKKHLPDLTRFYKPEELVKGLNIFYTLSESVNEDGINKIKEIQKLAVKEIHAILSDSKYAGTIPYFTINLADTLKLGQGQ